jgi:mRNA-degrading endonuclease toxin of MazEF toxin-antitoxin module
MRRPVFVIQSNPFNESRIATVIVAVITSNLALAEAPGNVRIGRQIGFRFGQAISRECIAGPDH